MEYSVIASLYDKINGEAYQPYAEYLREAITNFARIPVTDVLDLGCGTGRIAAILADMGYNMVALDISPEMLNIARENNAGKNTLLLQQDMRSFELYGTVQAIYSSFDCLNYIRTPGELSEIFRLVNNYLEPGGVFLFDVNTSYRFREVYANNTYVYEFENEILYWRNELGSRARNTRFILDHYFDMKEDGTCRFEREEQVEYLHSKKQLCSLASASGLLPLAIYNGLDFQVREHNAEKEYYVLVKPLSGTKGNTK